MEKNKEKVFFSFEEIDKRQKENDERKFIQIEKEKQIREEEERIKVSQENNIDVKEYSDNIKNYYNKNENQIKTFSNENSGWLNCVSDVLNEDLSLRDNLSMIIKFRLYFFTFNFCYSEMYQGIKKAPVSFMFDKTNENYKKILVILKYIKNKKIKRLNIIKVKS